MRKLFLNLQFLLMPHYWIMNESYSKEIDDLMIELLDKFEFTEIEHYRAKLGNVWIWIQNQPHASMMPDNLLNPVSVHGRPSRKTILRAIKKLESTGVKVSVDSDSVKKLRDLAFS